MARCGFLNALLGLPGGLPELSSATRALRCALVVLAVGVAFACMALNSRTTDELAHFNTGVLYWEIGYPSLDPVHPILRAVYAIPAAIMGVYPEYSAFADLTTRPQQRAFLAARLLALTLFVGWAWLFTCLVDRWTGPHPATALLAVLLLEPTISAHGHLVTTDVLLLMPATLLLLVTRNWFEAPQVAAATGIGLLAGLCLLAKYSAVVWLAGYALGLVGLLAFQEVQRLRGHGPDCRAPWSHLLVMLGVGWLTLGLPYGYWGITHAWGETKFVSGQFQTLGKAFGPLPLLVPLRWAQGIDHLMLVYRVPYFLGAFWEERMSPWYFPLVLAMKPVESHLALLVVGLAALCRGWRRVDWRLVVLLLVPTIFFLGVASQSARMQLGVRHIFPVLVGLSTLAFVGLASTGARSRWWLVGCVLTGGVVLQGIARTPHQLASFNLLAGGPSGAWRWYNDSNQDWGQGVAAMERWLAGQEFVPEFFPVEGETTGWVALSTNMLTGLTPEQWRQTRWIREGETRSRFIEPCWHLYFIPEDRWVVAESLVPSP